MLGPESNFHPFMCHARKQLDATMKKFTKYSNAPDSGARTGRGKMCKHTRTSFSSWQDLGCTTHVQDKALEARGTHKFDQLSIEGWDGLCRETVNRRAAFTPPGSLLCQFIAGDSVHANCAQHGRGKYGFPVFVGRASIVCTDRDRTHFAGSGVPPVRR
jgi:hypothetical protein